METETHLWRCIVDHANQQAGPFQARVKPADIARATGLSEQLLSKWRYKATLPRPEQLAVVRDRVGVPYMALLEAALTDRGWLPEPGRIRTPSTREAEHDEAVRIGTEMGRSATTGKPSRRRAAGS